MPPSEFTFVNDPAISAAVNARLARYSRVRIASIKRAADPRPVVQRMADDMLELAGSGQTVDRKALALRGYTQSQLSDANLQKAQDIANEKAVRQVA